jgi:multidrug efflux pump subunit AcrA (membrane-fusion protein)
MSSQRFSTRLAVTAALACFAAVSGCAKKERPAEASPYVQTTRAQAGEITPASSMSGIIAPYQNVAIQSSLTEPADAVYVQEGDHVRKGQVLAQLNTADLQAELASDMATANADRANTVHTQYSGNESIAQGNQTLNAAQANLSRDQNILDRDQKLYAQGFISLQQLQSDQATVRNDQSTLESAKAAVSANGTTLSAPGLQSSAVDQARAQEAVALAQADQVRVSISKATIVSPIDGVVVNRNLNPGEYPGTRQIFTLQQVSPVYAILRGSSDQIAGIGSNTTATVTFNSGDVRRTFTGPVVGVLNEIQPGSTQFQVKVVLQNPGEIMRPGMPVQGRILLADVRGVRVPVTAFTDDNHDNVLIVQADNTVKTVSVKEIASDGTTSVISGVSAGTLVVSNGQTSVADGEKVSLQP